MSAFQIEHNILFDYDVQTMPPRVFKIWINLLAFSCACPITGIAQTARLLRVSRNALVKAVEYLLDRGLLELDENANLLPSSRLSLPVREPISKEIRAEVLRAGKCRRCGRSDRLTVDHIRPITAWGTNEKSNLDCLCGPCNTSKGKRFKKGEPAKTWTPS